MESHDSPELPGPSWSSIDLRQFRTFQKFPKEQLDLLTALALEEEFARDQVLIKEGAESADFYVVLFGGLEARRHTAVGDQTLARANVGQVFGELSFLDSLPRSCTVTALTPGSLLRFPAAEVRRNAAENPELAPPLLRVFWHTLAEKIRQANQQMNQIISPGMPLAREGSGATPEQVDLTPAKKQAVFRERGLSAAVLRLLATTLHAERFGAEEYVFVEGERGTALYIVVDGEVRISRRMPGMGEEALAILGRGGIFGEMALVDGEPRSADARAHTEGCTLLSISQPDIEEIVTTRSEAAFQFLLYLDKLLCDRLRAMYEKLVSWRTMAGYL